MDTIVLNPEGSLLNYSNTEMVVNIIAALAIGVLLSLVYRFTHKGLSYSQSYTQTLVFVTVIVAIVMMVIGSSLARAFALVGALSIIRFRTVLKDTKDMAYVFSSLALGMAAGTGNYFLATVGFLFIASIALIMKQTNFGAIYKSEFILRFRLSHDGDNQSHIKTIEGVCKRFDVLHMEPSGDNKSVSLTYDIALRDDITADELTRKMGSLDNVSEVVLIASTNDVDY
ncbi:MAG: putative membrane protein YhiD involved in acid resistance [Parasphingorhabdus sp.]